MQAIAITDPELIAKIRRLGIIGDERVEILDQLLKEFGKRAEKECEHIDVEHASIWNAIREANSLDNDSSGYTLDVEYIDSGTVFLKKKTSDILKLLKELI